MQESTLNKIISAAYNDAGIIDKIRIYLLCRKDAEARKVFNDYRQTAKLVAQLRKEEFSVGTVHVVEKVKTSVEHSFLADLYGVLFENPVRSVSVAAVIVLVVISSVVFQQHDEPSTFTRQEIEQADIQARQALAMVGSILNKTKSSVINEIIPDKVSKPINKGFNVVKDLLHEEKKNENIN